MKKIKLFIVFVLVGIAVCNIQLSVKKDKAVLSLQNTEALATEYPNDIKCGGNGSISCLGYSVAWMMSR